MLAQYVLGIVIIANVLLAALILSRNSKSKVNQLYTLLALTVIIWSVAQFISNQDGTYAVQLFANKAAFAAGLMLIAVVWSFSFTFPKRIRLGKLQKFIGLILLPVTTLLTLFTAQMVVSVSYVPEKQVTDVKTGGLYLLYIVLLVMFIGFVIRNFYSSYHAKDTNSVSRLQITYTAYGVFLTFVWIAVTTAVMPAITNDWGISRVGILGSLFLVGFIAYAIIRHKMFDIRLIVARSIGYALTLLTISFMYGFVAFSLIGRFFFKDQPFDTTQQVVNTILAVTLVFTFPPIRRFFDRISNSLFYRDAYDPQFFLDQLNQVLVSNIELNTLLQESARTIEANLKSEFGLFQINKTETSEARIIGSKRTNPVDEITMLTSTQRKAKLKTIVVDELDEGSPLRLEMRRHNIALIAELNSEHVGAKEPVGYLILGDKRSGNPYTGNDVRMIEIIANELVIAIQNALRFEEIQTFNITLQQKVDDATRQLRKTNEKLKMLDQTKDEFISMASHQLRTPLTSVKGYVSMVMEGDAGKLTKKQNDLLAQAFASSQRMVYLISDLLNVSRLQTGKFVIENKPTELPEVVETELSQLTEAAKARNLELSYHKPAKFPALMLDETKIRQVIMNFVDNAIYYTPAGGHIKVELVDKPTSVEFTVVDDGLGVPKADQHHLFSKFYRAGNARKARPDGTGLGLFMAQKVIVAQGGAIIFTSSEGKGSTFGFTLPKAKLQVHEPAKS